MYDRVANRSDRVLQQLQQQIEEQLFQLEQRQFVLELGLVERRQRVWRGQPDIRAKNAAGRTRRQAHAPQAKELAARSRWHGPWCMEDRPYAETGSGACKEDP